VGKSEGESGRENEGGGEGESERDTSILGISGPLELLLPVRGQSSTFGNADGVRSCAGMFIRVEWLACCEQGVQSARRSLFIRFWEGRHKAT